MDLDRVSEPGSLTEGRLDAGRADLQQLLGQFRSNYPMGSLTADLLAIQADQYIVRANIQAGGTLLATAMAAESSLELAEDRARLRALELIGITLTSVQTYGQPMGQQYWPYAAPHPVAQHPGPTLATQSTDSLSQSLAGSAVGSVHIHSTLMGSPEPGLVAVEPIPESISAPHPEPALDALVAPIVPVEPITLPVLEPGLEPIAPLAEPLGTRIAATIVPEAPGKAKAKGQPKAKAELTAEVKVDAPIAPPTTNKRFVADWSEELSQIEVEMKRLRWSDAQEADYLQRTYGQRSRDYITDFDQLTGYLSYLRTLPSHFSPAIESPAIGPDADQIAESMLGLGTHFSDQISDQISDQTVAEVEGDDGPPWVDPGPEADLEEFAGPQVPVLSTSAPSLHPESIALANGGPTRPAPSSPPSREAMLDESAAECKRLKWTNRQGSDYLKATYGKPTRKDLNNDDLWDFLQYLRSLSMTSEQLPF